MFFIGTYTSRDPVIDPEGNTYEREAISSWY